jgi:hypothetical protein
MVIGPTRFAIRGFIAPDGLVDVSPALMASMFPSLRLRGKIDGSAPPFAFPRRLFDWLDQAKITELAPKVPT